MDNKNNKGKINNFICASCDFITQYKCNYTNHLMTSKHKRVTMGNEKKSDNFVCYCGNKYKNRHTLSRHKKNCNLKLNNNNNDSKSQTESHVLDKTIIIDLINQNKDLQNLLIQQAREYKEETMNIMTPFSNEKNELMNKLIEREPGNNTINGNVTTNNNNQKFNLNFFLNETCKDAMSIQEFLENLVITFEDLLLIGDAGFVTGVSDILIKQLRDLDVSKRPIHCTDSKRETIYLKQDTVWNKDDKDKTTLKQIIEKLEYKNVVALRDWCNENPDARVNNTPNNILKDKIYFQTLQGDERTRDKIIKNISKEVVVDKDN